MQIDKPEGGELLFGSTTARALFVEPAAPAAAEPSQSRGRMLPRPTRSLMSGRRRDAVGVVLIGGATLAAALIGHTVVNRTAKLWYRTLKKPSWTPPDQAFGVVWPVLYALSAVSAWRIWRSPPSRERSAALGFWVSQMATNAAWTLIFFGRKKPVSALADLKANLASAVGYALAAGKVDRTAGLLMVPYVGWVTFAGSINTSIVRHNASGVFARLGFRG